MKDPENDQAQAADPGGQTADSERQDDEAAASDESPDGGGAGEEFDYLKDRFRASYREGAADGPSRDELIEAFRTLGEAISHTVAGAGNTLKDPAVKQQVKKTAVSVFSTISTILLEWGSELKERIEERRGADDVPPKDSPPVREEG